MRHIRPGQRVVDTISDTLPAHVDFTEVSTVLIGSETLAVVFHLRDVPETLEFYSKNVPDDALEYKWEVSIDVDNDPETGLLGAEYSNGRQSFCVQPRPVATVFIFISVKLCRPTPGNWTLAVAAPISAASAWRYRLKRTRSRLSAIYLALRQSHGLSSMPMII